MGRKKLYRTKEEKNEQSKLRMRKYYIRHREEIKFRNRKRYSENVGQNMSDVFDDYII